MHKSFKLILMVIAVFLAFPFAANAASTDAQIETPVLKTISNNSSGVRISWSKVSDASGYFVYRRRAGNSKYSKIAEINSNDQNAYIDKTAKSGASYSYTVAAYRNGQKSRTDKKGLKITYVQSPTVTASASQSSNSISLKWSQCRRAAGYQIYRKINGTYQCIAVGKGSENTSFTDTGLPTGKTYEYIVVAYKGSYTSAEGVVSCRIDSAVIETLSESRYYAVSANASLSGSGTGYHSKVVIGWADAAVSFGIQYDRWAAAPYTGRTVFLMENVLSPSRQEYTRFPYNGSYDASLNTNYNLTLTVDKSTGQANAYVNNVLVGSVTNPNLVGHTLYCWVEGAARIRGDSVDTTFSNIKIISENTYQNNPIVSYVQTADGIRTNAEVNSKVNSVRIYGSLNNLAYGLDWDSASSGVNGYVRFY